MGSICPFELWLARAYPAAHRQAKKTATILIFSFITAGPAMSLPIRRGGSSGLLLGSSAAFQFVNISDPRPQKIKTSVAAGLKRWEGGWSARSEKAVPFAYEPRGAREKSLFPWYFRFRPAPRSVPYGPPYVLATGWPKPDLPNFTRNILPCLYLDEPLAESHEPHPRWLQRAVTRNAITGQADTRFQQRTTPYRVIAAVLAPVSGLRYIALYIRNSSLVALARPR